MCLELYLATDRLIGGLVSGSYALQPDKTDSGLQDSFAPCENKESI